MLFRDPVRTGVCPGLACVLRLTFRHGRVTGDKRMLGGAIEIHVLRRQICSRTLRKICSGPHIQHWLGTRMREKGPRRYPVLQRGAM